MNIKMDSSLWIVLSIMLLISTPAVGWIEIPEGTDMGCSPTLADPCTGYPSAPRGPSPEEQRHEQARLLLNKGVDAHNNGNYDQAIHLYEQALSVEPDYTLAQENLTGLLEWLQREKARLRRNQALEVINQGAGAFNNHDYDRAIELYEHALTLDPTYSEARDYINRAKQAKEQAEIDEELRLNRARIDAQVNALNNQADEISHKQASEAYERRDWQQANTLYFQAIELYEQALIIDPDSESAKRGIALAHKNIEGASKNYENGLINSFHNQGVDAYNSGNFADAVENYENALEFLKLLTDDRKREVENSGVPSRILKKLRQAQDTLAKQEEENKTIFDKVGSGWNTTKEWFAEFAKNIHSIDTDSNPKGGCSPSQDANVVDLCFDEEKELVESNQIPNVSDATMKYIKGARAVAEELGWDHDEISRLHKSIQDLEAEGDIGTEATVQEINNIWDEMLARGIGWLEKSNKGVGPGMPAGAGQQLENMDCAIFALANATGKPYSVVGTLAAELISKGDWRKDKKLHKNPQNTIERVGLTGGEVLMLTEALGQVNVVSPKDFTRTLAEGSPIMVNVVPQGARFDKDGRANKGHQVVLTKAFKDYGGTWYQMMDSNQGPIEHLYLSESQLMQIIQERGIVYKPDPWLTTIFLR